MSESKSESDGESELDGVESPRSETGLDSEPAVEGTDENVVLRTRDLTKFFGALEAVRDVSLDVNAGEILAIAGDNGAGKTTFIRMLSGVLQPTAGSIYLRQDGRLAKQFFSSSKDAMDAGIATVYQEQHLSPNATAANNIFLGMEPLKDGPEGWLLRRTDQGYMIEESRKLLAEIGFNFDPRSKVNELSGGQKQAVAVARALIRDPPIIILDEPTSEVSTTGTDKIIDLVRGIPDGEKSVILISHKIDVVVDVADRIAVMRDGEVIEVLDTNKDDIERIDIVERMHRERER
ncbi:ATP-binding cassette domain-containing protein [Halobellus ordinarius]|uniref:ATP-binding cassette domain-containing protein n=1 Tax=Halobellus ordinarius TaxID=3075120 RepID=UPI002880062A|nr:ATP-binding cassette domain-containing protein [Halobellus sp. ZY16]